MARAIGVKNLYYAKLLTDPIDGGTPTYETPVRVPKLLKFGTSNNYTSYAFYSDDITEEAGESLQTETVSIELGYLTNQMKADILGYVYDEKGRLMTSASVTQPSVALLYEISLSDGTSDYRVIYNCRLKQTEVENTTQGDSIESADVVLEGTAIPLKSLRIFDMLISSGDEKADLNVIDNFFKNVQLPIDEPTQG